MVKGETATYSTFYHVLLDSRDELTHFYCLFGGASLSTTTDLTLSINRCRHRDLRRLELFAPHLGALPAAARHSGILLPLPSHRHDGGLLIMMDFLCFTARRVSLTTRIPEPWHQSSPPAYNMCPIVITKIHHKYKHLSPSIVVAISPKKCLLTFLLLRSWLRNASQINGMPPRPVISSNCSLHSWCLRVHHNVNNSLQR